MGWVVSDPVDVRRDDAGQDGTGGDGAKGDCAGDGGDGTGSGPAPAILDWYGHCMRLSMKPGGCTSAKPKP